MLSKNELSYMLDRLKKENLINPCNTCPSKKDCGGTGGHSCYTRYSYHEIIRMLEQLRDQGTISLRA